MVQAGQGGLRRRRTWEDAEKWVDPRAVLEVDEKGPGDGPE